MKSFLWRAFKWSLLIGSGIGLLILIIFVWWAMEDFVSGQQFDPRNLNYSVVILDQNGEELHRNFSTENREWSYLSQVPQHITELTLLAEDRRFYDHIGVDAKGIARAMVANVESGRFSQGASTLTQQIARKAFLSDDKTIQRKLREVAISFGIEWSMSKDEILELYLNTAPYGATVAGVGSAAGYYFAKSVDQLTIAESIVLAALPKDPVRLSSRKRVRDWLGRCIAPVRAEECHPFNAAASYQPSRVDALLLQYAAKQNWDDATTLSQWKELADMNLPPHKPFARDEFQHFQFFVRNFLADKDIDLSDHPGGLRIYTTLDANLQRKMYDYMREEMGARLFLEHNAENFAGIVIDHDIRGPVVWIGSKAFWNEQISGQVDMLRARRQMGSAMKPFVFAAAMEQGYEPNTRFLDTRVQFAGERHVLQNADGVYMGWMGMAKALAQSRNVPAAQALYLAGGETAVKKYLDSAFGFDILETYPDHPFGWTLALGTAPVRLHDAANAYATLGSGEMKELCPILRIENQLGEELPNPCNRTAQRKLTPEVRFFMASMLNNPAYRPQWYWQPIAVDGLEIAAKTGTSNKRIGNTLVPADNMLASYTPNTTMLLWTGNTDGKALNAGSFAIQSLGDYFEPLWGILIEDTPTRQASFELPEGVYKYGQYWVKESPDPKRWTIDGMVVLGGHWGGGGGAAAAPAAPAAVTIPIKKAAPAAAAPTASAPAPVATPAAPAPEPVAAPTPPPAPVVKPAIDKNQIRLNIQERYN